MSIRSGLRILSSVKISFGLPCINMIKHASLGRFSSHGPLTLRYPASVTANRGFRSTSLMLQLRVNPAYLQRSAWDAGILDVPSALFATRHVHSLHRRTDAFKGNGWWGQRWHPHPAGTPQMSCIDVILVLTPSARRELSSRSRPTFSPLSALADARALVLDIRLPAFCR